ncbi:hypothetical protein FSARC_8404 [Fusarium sarcochroum]|uniref:Geranylgeranyl pyrophosphate synthetase n=1 Tax=Fusarium sarcochroum TaxID=1208366 RepID=A0A8H4X791_9HYPO|nr:hypothetical protein FSARC_8404 [Fusarium sarcochroum]
MASSEKWLFTHLGVALASLNVSQIQPTTVPVSSDGGHELLCSYSWTSQDQPTAYVPGEPSRYVSRPIPLSLLQDKGVYCIDQNSDKNPQYPFEVVFRAMKVMKPGFKFDDIDIVINRNTLRKLLQFCEDTSRHSWRIDLYLVGNTLVVERHEKSTIETLGKAPYTVFGHNFERAVTMPPTGMRNSVGHHRVLRYDLGGLNCAVRFEVDAAYRKTTDMSATVAQGGPQQPISEAQDSSASHRLTIVPHGIVTPHEQAAEIKSIRHGGVPLNVMLPQLWFGRTRYLIRGFHDWGDFSSIQVDNVNNELKQWEEADKNQDSLRKVAGILGQMREIVKNSETKSCAVIWKSDNPQDLQVFATAECVLPLPDGLIAEFWDKS